MSGARKAGMVAAVLATTAGVVAVAATWWWALFGMSVEVGNAWCSTVAVIAIAAFVSALVAAGLDMGTS